MRAQMEPNILIGGAPLSFGREATEHLATMVTYPRQASSLERFFENLLEQQESLGENFAQVLYDHAWELYAR
jgi:hypothetical protein